MTACGGARAAHEPPRDSVSSSEIDLNWTASPSGGVTGYNVYRDGGGTPVGSVNAPITSFQDTGLGAGTTHTYVVTAFNATSESAPSNQASATTQGGGSVTVAAAGNIACSPHDPNYNGGAGTGQPPHGKLPPGGDGRPHRPGGIRAACCRSATSSTTAAT